MGKKKTDSLARSVALLVSRAVASESFCCVKLKYYAHNSVSLVSPESLWEQDSRRGLGCLGVLPCSKLR